MKFHERMIGLKKEMIELVASDIEFDFENAAFRAESELSSKLAKCCDKRSLLLTEYQRFECELDSASKKYNEISNNIIDIDLIIATYEDELLSLNEMKVISLFRLLELRIGRFIAVSFREKVKSGYKWDAIKSYFKAKGINISTITHYQEVNRLRKVNNAIKHSGDISEVFREIGYITNDEHLSHEEMSDFYNKSKKNVLFFLRELSEAIQLALFVYDEKRIDAIVGNFTKTMNRETLELLSAKLKLASENIDEHVPNEFKIVLGSDT